MQWREEFHRILSEQFAQKKQRNRRYSVRSFAKLVGVSPGTMSELLNGKGGWNLSNPRALEILDQLRLESAPANRLRIMMGEKISVRAKQLGESSSGLLSNAAYQAVLFGLDLPFAATDPDRLRRRLGLDEDCFQRILEELHAAGLTERGDDGLYRRKKEVLMAVDGVPKTVLKQHHLDNLERTAEALEKFPTEARDITTLTLTGSKERLETVRREIREFYNRLMVLMADDHGGDEVYRISVGVFPLTSPEPPGDLQ